MFYAWHSLFSGCPQITSRSDAGGKGAERLPLAASASGADHRLPDAFKAFLAGERVREELPDLGIHLRAGVREGALEARDAHHGALRHHLGDVRAGTVL